MENLNQTRNWLSYIVYIFRVQSFRGHTTKERGRGGVSKPFDGTTKREREGWGVGGTERGWEGVRERKREGGTVWWYNGYSCYSPINRTTFSFIVFLDQSSPKGNDRSGFCWSVVSVTNVCIYVYCSGSGRCWSSWWVDSFRISRITSYCLFYQ